MNGRFARHHLIPGWNQDRLAAARVVVAGAGARGNAAVQTLALAGVGNLLVIDPDSVELSNLSRAPLFSEADIGRPKADALVRAVRRVAPECKAQARIGHFESVVGLGELMRADLIVGCLDSHHARIALASRAALAGTPIIDAGTNDWGGEVRLFTDLDGACYSCGLSPAQRRLPGLSCADAESEPMGASAAASMVIGAWQGHAALRALLGVRQNASAIVIDPVGGSARSTELRRDPDCMFHARIGRTVPLGIGHTARVSDFLAALPEPGTPLAWHAFEIQAPYSSCGGPVLTRATEDLSQLPRERTLASAGIPPIEVLKLRTDSGYVYLALD